MIKDIQSLVGLDQSAVPRFDELKKYFDLPDFRIGGTYDLDDPGSFHDGGLNGTTLESMKAGPTRIGYITLGSPHRNDRGEVDNAILICPYYSGDSTNMLDFWGEDGSRIDFSEGVAIGPGRVFDTDRYYIIVSDALGLWGASKPSSSRPGDPSSVSLGLRFPSYSLFDCVQLQYRLLKDELGIDRLRLVTGVSLGAALTYVWGVMYPDFMDAVMPIGGTPFQDKGMARWLFDLMTAAIQSDPVYRSTGGEYYHLPRLQRPIQGNLFGWSLLRQSGFVDEYRCQQTYDQYVAEGFDWEGSKTTIDTLGTLPGTWGRSLFSVALIDSNDLIYRNQAQALLDVEDELHRIKARSLIIHVSTDQWLHPHIAQRAHARIPGSRLITFPHDLGHYAVFAAPHRYGDDMRSFIDGSS